MVPYSTALLRCCSPADNKEYGNRLTLNVAEKLGKCLFTISKENTYPMADYYRCLTCDVTASGAICENCIRNCHKDHVVRFHRRDRWVWFS